MPDHSSRLCDLQAHVHTTCVLTCARCDYRIIGSEDSLMFALRCSDNGWRPGTWRGRPGALCPECAKRRKR